MSMLKRQFSVNTYTVNIKSVANTYNSYSVDVLRSHEYVTWTHGVLSKYL